jgi:hydroxymethylglutaryl-CoA lyase
MMRDGNDVHVCEVGLRDGLQNIQTFFPTDQKIEWIKAEAASGMPEIEVCSFVPPKLIPQFKDAKEVCAAALEIKKDHPDLVISALMPNFRGGADGIAAGVDKLNYVTSVSEKHNMANVRKTSDESVEDFRKIVALRDEKAKETGKRVTLFAGLSTALGCTIEGPVDPAAVLRLAEKFLDAGADELAVADTVGYANPTQVKTLFKLLFDNLPKDVVLTVHLHDTRGLGIANANAALEAGVRRFDASLAGLGGCPYAPGATGNIVMDDLVFMLESMGLKTGVDLDKLVAVREIVARNLPGEQLYGGLAKSGPPKGYVPASRMAAAAE